MSEHTFTRVHGRVREYEVFARKARLESLRRKEKKNKKSN